MMGKVLAVDGIQPMLLAAIDAGVKTVILPTVNESDVANLPEYMRDQLDVVYVGNIQQALTTALVQ